MIKDLPGKVTIHSMHSKRENCNTVPVEATIMITKNIDLPDCLVNFVVGIVEINCIDEQSH